MDTQQTTETSAKMQQNLHGIETVRQQVQQVADAYGSTRTQTADLATDIHQMTDDMNNSDSSISKIDDFWKKIDNKLAPIAASIREMNQKRGHDAEQNKNQ